MAGKLFYWVANWNLSRAQAALLLHGPTADMVDCIGASFDRCIHAYPHVKRFAGYVTGSSDIRWTPEQFARIPDDAVVLSIDQSNGDLPIFSNVRHVVKDEETGAATIPTSVEVARQRILGHGEDYCVYCEQSILTETENAMVRGGLPHGEIVAYQYASPSSNPGQLLPGTNLDLRQANADLSVVRSDWLALPGHAAPPEERASGEFSASVKYDHDAKRVSVRGTPGDVKRWGNVNETIRLEIDLAVGPKRGTGEWTGRVVGSKLR